MSATGGRPDGTVAASGTRTARRRLGLGRWVLVTAGLALISAATGPGARGASSSLGDRAPSGPDGDPTGGGAGSADPGGPPPTPPESDGHLGPALGPGRWLLVAVGVVLIGAGAVLAFQAVGTSLPSWFSLAAWFLLPPLLSDLLLMPLAAVLAWVAGRRLGRWAAPVVVGLALSAVLVAIGWPFLGGFGRKEVNPSLLDRPYWTGLAGWLVAVWAGVLVAGVVRTLRRRATPPS